MIIDDIIRMTKRICDGDQSILTQDLQDWIDMGINYINQQLGVNIPTITGQPTATTSPAFDSRYHEVLVYHCVMMYRLGDSDYNAAQVWDKKFQDMVSIMQRDMPINPSIRDDDYTLQLVAVDTTGIFNINQLPQAAYFGTMQVFQNDTTDVTDGVILNQESKQMTIDISRYPIAVNDKITIIYEENPALENPTFEWWGRTGW